MVLINMNMDIDGEVRVVERGEMKTVLWLGWVGSGCGEGLCGVGIFVRNMVQGGLLWDGVMCCGL